MKIFYMNDENIPVVVQVNAQHNPDPLKFGDHITYETLQPSEGKVFEFTAPEGSIPYVKKWNRRNQVLLSYMPSSDQPNHHVEQDV